MPLYPEKHIPEGYEEPGVLDMSQTSTMLPVTGQLKLPLMPFVYNSLYTIHDIKDADYAVSILKNFEYLVCAEPGRLVEREIQVSEAIKDSVKILGYVHLGGNLLPEISKIQREIDRIRDHGWYGVFIDQFGYDFGETRERQNEVVEYAHSQGLVCFINCWFIEDAFSDEADEIHNPKGVRGSIGKGDWYLMESYYDVKMTNPSDFFNKCRKAAEYRNKFGVKIACLTYKRKDAAWAEVSQDIENSYLTCLLFGFDAWWYTDRLESDSFNYGNPEINIGERLVYRAQEILPGLYLSQTDQLLFLYDMSNYPEIKKEVFTIK